MYVNANKLQKQSYINNLDSGNNVSFPQKKTEINYKIYHKMHKKISPPYVCNAGLS